MLQKTVAYLFLMPFLFASHLVIGEKATSTEQREVAQLTKELQGLVDEAKLSNFNEFLQKCFKTIRAFSKNDQGCFLNLFAGQFVILKYATSMEKFDQEQLMTMLQAFKKTLDDFQNQCSEKVVEL